MLEATPWRKFSKMAAEGDLGPLMRTFTEGASAERLIVPLSVRRVADVMSADVVSVEEDADLREVIETMLAEKAGALAVVDGDGTVTGIISHVDVLRAVSGGLGSGGAVSFDVEQ